MLMLLQLCNPTQSESERSLRPQPDHYSLVCETSPQVVEQCDITYSMLSTPEVVAKVFFDPEDGSLAGLSEGKSFIDCATLEVEVSQTLHSWTATSLSHNSRGRDGVLS